MSDFFFFLIIFHATDPPKFTEKPQTTHAYEQTNARFPCAVDGFPKPAVNWRKNGELVESGAFTKLQDGYLVVEDLVFSDMGIYQCFASNPLGSIQTDVELIVYRKGES